MYDNHNIFLVMEEENDALSNTEGIQQFHRGLIAQLFIEELRNNNIVFNEKNLVVCWVSRLIDGKIAMPGSDASTSVVYRDSHLNKYFWQVIKGGCYGQSGLVLMMKISVKQEDIPLGDTYPQLVARIVRILNMSVADTSSALYTQLRPFGQIFASTEPPCEPDIPDHKEHAEARRYREQASVVYNTRYQSQDALSQSLNSVRAMQQAIMTSIKKREPWSHLADEYRRQEQDTLTAAKDLSKILKECSNEEESQVSVRVAAGPPRSVAGDFFETLTSRAATTVLDSNPETVLPSEQVSHLRKIELEAALSPIRHMNNSCVVVD